MPTPIIYHFLRVFTKKNRLMTLALYYEMIILRLINQYLQISKDLNRTNLLYSPDEKKRLF